MHDEDLRGAVAEASNGSIGVIYKQKKIGGEWLWLGLSFNGNPWSSRRPKILAYTVHEYVARQVEDKIVAERKAYLDAIRRLRGANATVNGCVATINARASSRREERRLCPITAQQREETATPQDILDVQNQLQQIAVDPNMVIVTSHDVQDVEVVPLENPPMVAGQTSGGGNVLLESLRRTA